MNTVEEKIVVSIYGYSKVTRSGNAKLNGYRNKSKEHAKEMKRRKKEGEKIELKQVSFSTDKGS